MNYSRPISIGVIGCGTIAFWGHLRSLRRLPNLRVTALADRDPDALVRAKQLVDAQTFSTVDDLLSKSTVDAVVIASPTPLHARHVLAACAARKHVYLEKPLAHNAASLSDIQRSSADTGLVIAVGYNLRFHPVCQQARQRISSGSIGAVRAIISNFSEPTASNDMPDWRRDPALGGGVLLDLASHHIDLYRWFLKDELTRNSIDTRSMYSDQDSAFFRASSRGGVELCGYFAYTSARSHRISFYGSTGVLHLDLHSGLISEERNRRFGYGTRRHLVLKGATGLVWRTRKLFQPSYNPSYKLALRAFVESIATPERRNTDLATVTDGAAALQAILDAETETESDGDPLFISAAAP